jgi:CheY-like chemotaxis protein
MPVSERPRILLVDDEPALLEGLERHLRKPFEVHTSTSAAQALELIALKGPFAVVVSDMRMPHVNGAVFLARVREIAPDTVRLLLTGHADTESAIAAVNEGQIFRFLTKPCPSFQLQAHLDEAVKHHNLLQVERTLLEKTLRGAIKALTDVIALTSPLAAGRGSRMRTRVTAMCDRLRLTDRWHIEVAAMLCELGAITLPEETAKKYYSGTPLDKHEQSVVTAMAKVGRTLIADIPRMEPVLALLDEYAAAVHAGSEGKCSALGAQMLLLARDLDVLESTGTPVKIAARMLASRRERYGEKAIEALAVDDLPDNVVLLALNEVLEHMVFAEDVKTEQGTLLVARGYEVTQSFLIRARAYRKGYVIEPLSVYRKREAKA